MSSEYNDNKYLLYASAVLGCILLVSGAVLLRQMDELLNRYKVMEVTYELPPEVPVEQFYELPSYDGYILCRDPTEHQIELFELLSYSHDQFYETGSDKDLEKYASAIVRNFVADFFTLSNKNARSDVGGLQFFSEEVVDDFKNFAIDNFYLYLNQYIEIYGSGSLPTVLSTKIQNVDFGTRIIEIEDEDSRNVNEDVDEVTVFDYESDVLGEEVRTIIIDAEWSYENSTLWYIKEFQTSARFILIPSEEKGVKIYVIELPEIEYENIEDMVSS